MRLVIIAALVSGVLLWAASPAGPTGWIAWVALVPVATASVGRTGSRHGWLAVPLAYCVYLELLLVPALPFGLAEGQFGDPFLPVLVGDSPVFVVALVAVPLLGALLYAVRFGSPPAAGRGCLAIAGAVAFPALAWTALDFARANLDPGGLWGPLFLSQADQPSASIAAIGGPWLITLVLASVGYGIAAATVHRRPLAALVPIALAISLTLAGEAIKPAGERTLRVAAVQPGYDTAEEDRTVLRRFEPGTFELAALDLIRDLGELTRDAAAEGAELIVWPEASMYADPRTEPRIRAALLRLARSTGATVVVPFFKPYPVREGYAIAVVPAAGGRAMLTDARAKQRPLWVVGENRAAGEPAPIEAADLRLGTLLGTDPQDARIPALLAGDGVELLTSSTHDWRQSAAPQRAYARLAAAAARVPVVRADWRYGSAIYSHDGEQLASAGDELRRVVVLGDVSIGSATTPYTWAGDVVGWLAVACVGAAGVLALWRRFRG